MRAQQEHFPVATMSRVLRVSGNGFYAWNTRGPSRRACEDVGLSSSIKVIHADSQGTYGVNPRIHAELAASGVRVARKRIARLMRQKGLRGVNRRKWTTTTVRSCRSGRP